MENLYPLGSGTLSHPEASQFQRPFLLFLWPDLLPGPRASLSWKMAHRSLELLHLWRIGNRRGDRAGTVGKNSGPADGPYLSRDGHHLDAARPGPSGWH